MPTAATVPTVLGLIQMRMSADPEENLTRAISRIRDAAGRGANVICLPELFRSPYFCQTEDHTFFSLAEPIPGPTTVLPFQEEVYKNSRYLNRVLELLRGGLPSLLATLDRE